ncbi:hypothetical protein [Dongia deserti]|uniref:hypothetical protein n=1 Tax=Dongia deserti TaxID=2268030 RepID=UPI0025495A90|nr:hypothetical protein [Dongia deserti]
MKRLVTAIALTIFMSGAAFASSCPLHVKKIDDVLAAPPGEVSTEVLARAKELRDQGEALHKEGKHAESMSALTEAEILLGIGQ